MAATTRWNPTRCKVISHWMIHDQFRPNQLFQLTKKKATASHLANGPWKKSLNFIFPTNYGIPKSLKG